MMIMQEDIHFKQPRMMWMMKLMIMMMSDDNDLSYTTYKQTNARNEMKWIGVKFYPLIVIVSLFIPETVQYTVQDILVHVLSNAF